MKETEDFDQTWAVPSDDLDATWPMISAAPETAQAADESREDE